MAPRILIFGTGGIGIAYAYIFSRVIPTSHLITVCRSNYEAASKNGFTINSAIWGENLKFIPVVVRSVSEGAELDPSQHFDYVIICSKALPTSPSTPKLIKPAISPSTTIVLIQNGIAIEEPYAKLYPENPLLSTVVYFPANQTSPGVVLHSEKTEMLHIGAYPASSNTDSATKFAKILTDAGATTKVHADVQFERWSKLVVNASWNPICALTRSRDAQFLHSSPDATEFVKDVMLEIAAVANACGYPDINVDLVAFQLNRATARKLPGVDPSMYVDAMHGRNMEVEAIVGNVIGLAKEKGVRTPLLRAIYMLVAGLDDSFTREKQ